MYPIEDYPYKELADKFGMEVITVQHMVNWIKTKPEGIAYLRSIYSPESLPDWVGDIEGVDYGEFLKSKGVDVPQPPTNNDDVNDDYDVDDGGDDDVMLLMLMMFMMLQRGRPWSMINAPYRA